MTQLDMSLLWHYVEKWAARKPDDEAFVFGEERLTWAQFQDLMDRTAKAFLAAGVERDERKAISRLGAGRPWAGPNWRDQGLLRISTNGWGFQISRRFFLDSHGKLVENIGTEFSKWKSWSQKAGPRFHIAATKRFARGGV